MPPAENAPDARELLVTGLLGLAVTFTAVAAFFGPGILTGDEVFFTLDGPGSDFWHLNYPFRRFFATSLSEGSLPLWCPDIGTGFPLLAEGQISALYPPNLLLYSVLPFTAALNWEILLHLVLGGAFAAMFARQRGAGRGGGVLTGVVYGLSGFLLVHLKHTNMITAAAWLPAILLLLERRTFVLLAVTIGLMVVGGHPQIAYNNLLLAGVYGICLLIGRRSVRGAAVTGGTWLLAVILGVGLAAPQLLPTRELKDEGPRKGGLSVEEATKYAYAPRHLVLFVAPKALGDPADGRIVVGPDGRERLETFDAGQEDPAIFWESTAYIGLLPLALVVVAFALSRGRRRLLPLAVLVVLSLVLALGKHAGLFTLLRGIVPGFDLFRFPSRFLLGATLGLAVLSGVGWSAVVQRTPAGVRFALPAILLLCFLDSRLALGDHNRRVDAERWLSPPPVVREIRERERGRDAPFRIASLDPERRVFHRAYREARGWTGDLAPYERAFGQLHANLGLLHGLNDIDVHSPSFVSRSRMATGPVAWVNSSRPEARRAGRKIASLYNVRYFIVPGSGLVENPNAMPRAFLVPRARPPHPEFDPRIEVLIEEDLPPDPPGGPIDRPVEIVEYSPQRVLLRADAPRDGWLFLSDTWYPGWEATVDGRTVTIHRANVGGRAVRVPAGTHDVAFDYRPTSFGNGIRIAALAGALLAIAALLLRRYGMR